MDVARMRDTQILNMRTYFQEKRKSSGVIEAIAMADVGLTPLHLRSEQMNLQERIEEGKKQQYENWKNKALHGRFSQELHNRDVDTEVSCKWLQIGEIYPETEGFMIAMQDQVIATNNYRRAIMKEEGSQDRCRSLVDAWPTF